MDHTPNEPQHADPARPGAVEATRSRHRKSGTGRFRRRTLATGALLLAVAGGASAVALDAVASTPPVVVAAHDRHGRDGGQDGVGESPQQTTAAASPQQQSGVVDVDTVLDYGTGRAAGTGIVLTSGGEILTNNHVVQGSTSITVTDVTSGRTYTAGVVGTDATDDVAVLALQGASGLVPATLASSDAQSAVAAGTAVTAVGNAGGTGGTPAAAPGTVLALGRTITAADEASTSSEDLSGLIEVQAGIESGDSGGPLYANGAVVGIDTAASASSGPSYRTAANSGSSAPTTGYAIPIGTALRIAGQITSGVQSGIVQQGYPAFLGVEVDSGTVGETGSVTEPATTVAGAPLSGVVTGSPAASAGLAAGDVVVSVDGQDVSGPDQLSVALASHQVGDHVSVTWVDASGSTHSARITLTAGPAA